MNKRDRLLETHAGFAGKDVVIECGKGWQKILDKLFETMAKDPVPVHILQVKEKFGGLRVYYDGGSDISAEALRLAENEADKTCEVCGAIGILCSGGWMRVLCDVHDKGRPK